jgi:hypothetical protein
MKRARFGAPGFECAPMASAPVNSATVGLGPAFDAIAFGTGDVLSVMSWELILGF